MRAIVVGLEDGHPSADGDDEDRETIAARLEAATDEDIFELIDRQLTTGDAGPGDADIGGR